MPSSSSFACPTSSNLSKKTASAAELSDPTCPGPSTSRTASASSQRPRSSRRSSADARATEPPVTDRLDEVLTDAVDSFFSPHSATLSVRRESPEGTSSFQVKRGPGSTSPGSKFLARNNSRSSEPTKDPTGSPRRSRVLSPCAVLGEYDDADEFDQPVVCPMTRPPETTPQEEEEVEGQGHMAKDTRRRSSAPPVWRRGV